MVDTYFFLPVSKHDRLTAVYGSTREGGMVRAPDGPTGEGDGVRIRAATVRLMTTNQVGTLHSGSGPGFALGFETVDRCGAGGLNAVGTSSRGGAYGSNTRIDAKETLVVAFRIRQIPHNTDRPSKFPTLVYQALIGTTPWE